MRKHILFSAAIVTALLLALGTSAGAQRAGGRGPGGPGPAIAGAQPRAGAPGRQPRFGRGEGAAPEARLARQLELTAEQREAIGAILRVSRDKTAPLAGQLRLAQQNLRRAVFADTREDGAVQALSSEVASLQQQIAELRLEAQLGVAAELSETQRAELRATSAGGPGRFGFGRGGPGGPAGRPDGPGAPGGRNRGRGQRG